MPKPGETAEFSISLENAGEGPARDLTVQVNSIDPNLQILGENSYQIPYLTAGSQTQINFTASVLATVNPEIPPVANLIIKDKEGTNWGENFYLGNPKKIHYPLGFIPDKIIKVEEAQNE
jgi:uncharacterized repeat protein (TIGR01451 family)